jgi:protein PET100
MFPIAFMYYYGINLDRRFAVPDFWPKPEQTNRIPFEKDEIHSELERLRQRRLYMREKRLQQDNAGDSQQKGNGSGL